MIPVLHSANTTSFSDFGIGHLSDAISPHVVEERNGEFTLEMQYPLAGENFNSIGMRSIIMAKPSPAQDPQPFRVFRITKPINGIVTISARHVRYDLEGVPVTPFTANGIANALQQIKNHALISNPFTFSTNKTNTQTMKLTAPASTLSLLGGVRGSLLDIYGGEYKYNIWNVSLLSSRGTDNGITIYYGVDLTDFRQEENCANVYTGVMCFWQSSQDGTTVTGDVQSTGTFDYQRILVVDKSGEYEEAPTIAQLNQRAVDYINNNKVGVPKIAINLSFVNLEQTEEFQSIRQSIELCDQITVDFPLIGVSAMARVIRTDYDVINERYISVEIGDSRTSLADSFVAVQTKVESAPTTAEMQQAINATTAAITGANGGAVRLLDTNDDKLPDTLYIADNVSPLLASKVWRFNYEGWGASEHGYDGPFTMGATFQAGFIADFITAGTLSADRIGANSIAVSKLTGNITNGQWKIDLDAGTLTIGELSAAKITSGTLSADRIGANSIAVSKLTGNITNGQWKIDLDAGTLTIGELSAAKITSGTLSADRIGANSIAVSKLTGSIKGGLSNSWEIDLTNGTMTIGNLSANNITAGTLNVDRIGPNSVGVGKLSGSISSGDWKIDLTNGTLTIGTISANKITSGTIDASQITVTNLNASNITVGTLNGSRITDGTISGGKIGVGEITGGVDYYGRPTGNLAANSIKGGNIDNLTITGSKIADTTLPGDKLVDHTLGDLQISQSSLSTASLSGGVNTSLGYADNFNLSTTKGLAQNKYPQNFTAGDIDAFKAFYSGSYKVREQGEVAYDLTGHYHDLKLNSEGKIEIGPPQKDKPVPFEYGGDGYDHASVLATNSSNYTTYDTGYSIGNNVYNPNASSGGLSTYARLGLYKSDNSLIKTLRLAMSVSVTRGDYPQGEQYWNAEKGHYIPYYKYVNNTGYVRAVVKIGTTEVTVGDIEVNMLVTDCIDMGGGGGNYSYDWSDEKTGPYGSKQRDCYFRVNGNIVQTAKVIWSSGNPSFQ